MGLHGPGGGAAWPEGSGRGCRAQFTPGPQAHSWRGGVISQVGLSSQGQLHACSVASSPSPPGL